MLANRISQIANRFIRRAPRALPRANPGFTLVEVLVVIALLGILSVIVYAGMNVPSYLEKTRTAHTYQSLESIARAAQIYAQENNGWAPDVNRSIPSEFSAYITPATWKKGTFPDSVFDYDYWEDQTCWDGSTGNIQISLRQVNNYKGKSDYVLYYVIKGKGIPHCSGSQYRGECLNCESTYP